MRGLRVIAIAITGMAASRLAAAEPPGAKVDLSRADRWQAGDVVTSTLQDVETFETALAVQAGVAATSEKDTTLEGAYVEVAGRGRDRRFTVVASPSTLTERAREWLGKRYGLGSGTEEDLRLARRPKAPVAIGEKWTADVGPILDVASPGEAVDRSKASVTYDLTFPLTSLPTRKGQPSAPWKKGGTYVVRGNETVGLEGRVTSGGSASQGLLQGEVTWRGRPMTVALQFPRQEGYRVGDEFPEPKASGGGPPK